MERTKLQLQILTKRDVAAGQLNEAHTRRDVGFSDSSSYRAEEQGIKPVTLQLVEVEEELKKVFE